MKISRRGELEVVGAINSYCKNKNLKLVESSSWIPVGNPVELLKADNILRNGKNLIGNKTKINGNVVNSSIGDCCKIDGNVKDSIIMDNVVVKNDSDVSNSILGENDNFSGKIYGAFIGDNVNADKVSIVKGIKVGPNNEINGMIDKDVE